MRLAHVTSPPPEVCGHYTLKLHHSSRKHRHGGGEGGRDFLCVCFCSSVISVTERSSALGTAVPMYMSADSMHGIGSHSSLGRRVGCCLAGVVLRTLLMCETCAPTLHRREFSP